MQRRRLELLSAAVGLAVFGLALWVLRDTLGHHDLGQILRQIGALPPRQLLLSAGLTVCAYLVLIGYDALAFRYISASLPCRRIALASFLGYAVGNNSGSWSLLTGGSLRFRFYSAWGIEPPQVTRVVVFCLFSFWVGFFFLGGLVFFFAPLALPSSFHLPLTSARPLGSLFLLLVAGYLLWTWRGRPLTVWGRTFSPPGTALALAQLLVSSLDWALAGSILFVLLPPAATLSWAGSLSIFMFAQLAGLASQVPGGLGVFESAILLLLRDQVPTAEVAGALLLFRLCYYLLPLLAAALLFGGYELLSRRR